MPNPTTNIRRIMLIDDSEIDLKINTKILSLHFPGISVTNHISAEEGFNYLKKNIAQQGPLPDCILLDIQMPDMDGFDFLELYKSLPNSFTGQCTVIILSSTLDFGDIIRAEANCYVFKLLRKPLNAADLKSALNI